MMVDLIMDLKREIKVKNYQNKVESVSVANISPVDTQQDILKFLDNSDGLFQARCNGFYEFLFSIQAPTKKKFRDNLKTELFTDNYCESHHWPNIV